MAAIKFISKYKGPDFDKAIEYILREHNLSVFKTLECSIDNKIDLNTLNYEEGVFTAQYFTNSCDDNDDSAVILTVVFLDDTTVLQRYNLNGTDVQRVYDTESEEWSQWLPVKPFLRVSENEEVQVPKDTIIMREITTDVDEFFTNEN